MVTANFLMTASGNCKGFSVSGHSGYSVSGSDIVCASVSSAVMLTINTANEFFGLNAIVKVDDNKISCSVQNSTKESDKLFLSLKEHLSAVSEEFPKYLKVNISEV